MELLNNPMLVVFSCLTICWVTSTVGYFWHKVQRDEMDCALKEQMLQQGLSADDIVKVLQASRKQRTRDRKPSRMNSAAGPVFQQQQQQSQSR